MRKSYSVIHCSDDSGESILKFVEQEYDSAATSINSNKLRATER